MYTREYSRWKPAYLVAVRRVYRPCCLIPSAFKVVRDLGKGEREHRKGEKSGLEEHHRRLIAVSPIAVQESEI